MYGTEQMAEEEFDPCANGSHCCCECEICCDCGKEKPMAKQLEMTDCYHKAEPDEPKFTLLGRDRAAPVLVRLWAAIREGNYEAAMNLLADIADTVDHYTTNPTAESQVSEACAIAGEMEQWRGKNRN